MSLNIRYYKNNTHIENSWKVNTIAGIEKEVYTIVEIRKAMKYPVRKKQESYVREWKAHNNLYNRGLFVKHTKDVDLEEPANWLHQIIFYIIGR